MSRLLTDDGYRAKIKAGVVVTDSGCWEWQGYRHVGNYGKTNYRGRQWATHRLAYTLFKGPIPAGLLVCHACDNKACCNPDHLWIGTQVENGRDLRDKGLHYTQLKTHCPQGHPYAEHAYVSPRGFRNCRMCQRIRQRINAGWPEDLARSAPRSVKGKNPPGKWRRKPVTRQPVTHCKYGHELSGDNLYLAPDGKRRCRKCQVRTVHATMVRWAEGKTATQQLQESP